MFGQLCERLGSPDAGGQSGPAQDSFSDAVCTLYQITSDPCHVDETFIDAVDLLGGSETRCER